LSNHGVLLQELLASNVRDNLDDELCTIPIIWLGRSVLYPGEIGAADIRAWESKARVIHIFKVHLYSAFIQRTICAVLNGQIESGNIIADRPELDRPDLFAANRNELLMHPE